MNAQFKILLAIILSVQFIFVSQSRATDVVTILAKYKVNTIEAPDPDYPVSAVHKGRQGQGIFRLVVNEKTGIVDEVKVMKGTGTGLLDATAVMTFFKWKFRPGSTKQQDVAVNFHLSGTFRDLH
jgi:TonB family protein